MKKYLIVILLAILAFSCKKKPPISPASSNPMSYININIAGNQYSDSANNDTGVYNPSMYKLTFKALKDKDYQTGKRLMLLMSLCSTKNVSWGNFFYAQKWDTSVNSGTYKTGISFLSYNTRPYINLTDRHTGRMYYASDTLGVFNITTYNDNEISGTFSFNVSAQIDAKIYLVSGDFKYRIK